MLRFEGKGHGDGCDGNDYGNVEGDVDVNGNIDVDVDGGGDDDGDGHWFLVLSLRFLPCCPGWPGLADIHQTHDWKFDEADWSPGWDLPTPSSFCCHFLQQSLKPCYIVICWMLHLAGWWEIIKFWDCLPSNASEIIRV